MPTFTPVDLVTTIAVIIAVSGAVWALRRQGDAEFKEDNEKLRQRVDHLETSNAYLLKELAATSRNYDEKLQKLEREYRIIKETYDEQVQELLLLKAKYERLADENKALTDTLGRLKSDGRVYE